MCNVISFRRDPNQPILARIGAIQKHQVFVIYFNGFEWYSLAL